MYKLTLSVLLAFLPLAPAIATINSSGDVLIPEEGLDLSRSFEAQRGAIVKALADGETYSEIASQDTRIVMDSLERISSLLDGAQDVEQLPEETKVQVFNEQERINSLLVPAYADSRVICRRHKPTGSNRPTNICLTVAERRRARDSAEDFFRYNPRAQGPVIAR